MIDFFLRLSVSIITQHTDTHVTHTVQHNTHARARAHTHTITLAVQHRPDYRKYLSLEILFFPYKLFAPQTPFKKIRKIQAKVIQGHVPWFNLKKHFQIDFSQYANNVGTPLSRFMRQAQNTDTHALNQLGVSRYSDPISLLISTFGIHLQPGYKSPVKSFSIAQLKMSKNNG